MVNVIQGRSGVKTASGLFALNHSERSKRMSTQPLKNPRHERFCQYLYEGHVATEAYKKAGYKSDGTAARVGASKLVTKTYIQERLKALQERGQKSADITVQSLTQQYQNAIRAASANDQQAVVIKGLDSLAKLHGLITEKHHNVNENFENKVQVSDEPASTDEWLNKHRPQGQA